MGVGAVSRHRALARRSRNRNYVRRVGLQEKKGERVVQLGFMGPRWVAWCASLDSFSFFCWFLLASRSQKLEVETNDLTVNVVFEKFLESWFINK